MTGATRPTHDHATSDPASEDRPRRPVIAFVATVLGAAVVVALLMGIPTDLIDTPAFTREVPPTWWSYPVWIITSILSGLLIATYLPWARPTPRRTAVPRVGGIGGIIGFLAVGCPVCNKVVLIMLGASGAMAYFEPVQPFLAMASLLLLVIAVVLRFRPARSCPVPISRAATAPDD